MSFRPGAWKVESVDGELRLLALNPGAMVGQPDWANHAALEGVVTVLNIRDRDQAVIQKTALTAMGISEADLSMFVARHGLEEE